MNEVIEPFCAADTGAVTDLLNYYIRHSQAVFADEPLSELLVREMMAVDSVYASLVIRSSGGKLLGFALARPHMPVATLSHVAELACFIHPEHTGRGLGAQLLNRLQLQSMVCGIDNFLVVISAANTGSIRFHERQGFRECGRFRNMVRRQGMESDTVWMQKLTHS